MNESEIVLAVEGWGWLDGKPVLQAGLVALVPLFVHYVQSWIKAHATEKQGKWLSIVAAGVNEVYPTVQALKRSKSKDSEGGGKISPDEKADLLRRARENIEQLAGKHGIARTELTDTVLLNSAIEVAVKEAKQ